MDLAFPDANAFRHVMGHFGSGVTVITCTAADGPVGFTASAVASISLEPLLVLVSVASDGETLEAIRVSEAFGVNILTRDQEAVALRFASDQREERFRDLALTTARTGAPLLETSLAWLDCRLHAEFEAGDHVLVLGRVEACGADGGEPLLYFRGQFGGWLS